MNRSLFLAIFLSLSVFQVYAQQTLQTRLAEDGINVDGIKEAAWETANEVNDFWQLEPQTGTVASEKTKVYSLQDEQNLYFLFSCSVTPGNEVVSRIQRRDQLNNSDDIVTLVLDTYNDKRTGLIFMVNALGTLTDGKITDDGKNVDYNWDIEWTAKTSVTDSLWITEIKIPFKNLPYNPKTKEWGVNFGRTIRSNQEVSWWTPVTESFRISQTGTLANIQTPEYLKHDLRLFPYATLRYENSDVSGNYDKVIPDAGLDLQYRYRSNLKANLTYNPDFATVEGDKEQINLTPWELRFPDKRLFFQDGNEMFGTRINTFYSRRIGDMQYGGKLTGKTGRLQYNALSARTEANEKTGDSEAWHNAIRLKSDFLNSSSIGATYADKITDTSYVRSLSMDYVLNLGKTWKLTGQYVGSAPGNWADHSAWFVRFARENNLFHYHIRYSNIGKNFQDNVNQTGYISDDDRREIDADIKYRFWRNSAIKYWYVSGKNNVFWSQEGVLRSWYLTYGNRLYFDNKVSFEGYYNNEFKYVTDPNSYLYQKFGLTDTTSFYNHYYKLTLGYNTDEASHVNVEYRFGKNFGRDFQLVVLSSRLQLFKKLSLSYEYNYLHYSPDVPAESTQIHVLGADYFFNKDLWIRLFAQNNSVKEKMYVYGLFGWRFKPPFGALYFIVNADEYYDASNNEYLQTQLMFVKLTYPIQAL